MPDDCPHYFCNDYDHDAHSFNSSPGAWPRPAPRRRAWPTAWPAGRVQNLWCRRRCSKPPQAGQRAFGENYIQEGVDKIARVQALAPRWRRVAVALHRPDPKQQDAPGGRALRLGAHAWTAWKIAQRLSEQRPAHLPPLQVCMQLNVDGGANKAGVPPEEARAAGAGRGALPRLQLRGVMSIPEPYRDVAAQKTVT